MKNFLPRQWEVCAAGGRWGHGAAGPARATGVGHSLHLRSLYSRPCRTGSKADTLPGGEAAGGGPASVGQNSEKSEVRLACSEKPSEGIKQGSVGVTWPHRKHTFPMDEP